MRSDKQPPTSTPTGTTPQPWPDLSKLIRDQLVRAVFQPIVSLRRAEVEAVEALTRPLPESGFADPGVLFAAADAFGKAWELERLTRDTIADAARALPPGRKLFFNSGPKVFSDPRFPDEIRRFSERSGLTPDRFVLEITERAETQHNEGLTANVRALRAEGYQIAVDDMGAGSSGLNRVMALRPQWLKLDRELVEGIHEDTYRQNLIRFLGYFARLGGAGVVAEGIEHIEELSVLIDLGVDSVQGFLLGRPGAIDQVLAPEMRSWLLERAETATPESTPVERLHSIETLAINAAACAIEPNPSETPLDPASTIAETLARLAERDDLDMMPPLPLATGNGQREVVRIPDLLRAAAKQLALQTSHRSPLYGLPDSVECDRTVDRLISSGDDRDAAIIDVRGMSGYNSAVGFELGDLLLRHLSTILRTATTGMARIYVGHLGEDRFLIVAPEGSLPTIAEEIILRFERASIRFARNSDGAPEAKSPSLSTEPAAGQWLAPPSLRVLVLPGVFRKVRSSRELRRAAEAARDTRADTNQQGSRIFVHEVAPSQTFATRASEAA